MEFLESSERWPCTRKGFDDAKLKSSSHFALVSISKTETHRSAASWREEGPGQNDDVRGTAGTVCAAKIIVH